MWNRLKVATKLLIGFGLVSSLFIGSAIFTLMELETLKRTAHQSARVDGPRALVGSEIQTRLVMGHLWFEELLAGDASLSFEQVLHQWEIAQSYAQAILEGGEVEHQILTPLADKKSREGIKDLLRHLAHLTELAKTRQSQDQKTGQSIAGSALDQAFDAAFEATLETAKILEASFIDESVLSSQEVDQVAHKVREQLIATLLVLVFCSILIPLLFSHFVVIRPLALLSESMEAMRKGDLSQKVCIKQQDEFGGLADAFNLMGERLQQIVGEVQKSCAHLASTTSEVAATAREQEASSKEQEATTHEIVASTREISATSKNLVANMNEVALAVDHAGKLAESGRGSLAQMGKTVQHMVEASQNISSKLTLLNEKASNITTVVTTINKVADQTNLLSVNAAIEADKAGEYGIGFGTVASEIRRLADQTAHATSDIEEMVREMQSAVSAGVMGMEKFSNEVEQGVEDVQQTSEQLTQIIERVQTLGPHFEAVHEGMEMQASGAGQIDESLTQLAETIQNNSEALRQSNGIIDQLNEASTRMRETVSVFKLAS